VEGGVDDGNYSDGGEEKGEDEGEDEDEDEDEDTSKLRPDKENRDAVRSGDAARVRQREFFTKTKTKTKNRTQK